MLRGEPNARIHAAATVAVVVLALWLGIDRSGWAWLVLAIGMVWAAESFNSALEGLADAVAPERNPAIGRAKDIAAGGVLCAALAAAAIGLLVLGPPLLARLGLWAR